MESQDSVESVVQKIISIQKNKKVNALVGDAGLELLNRGNDLKKMGIVTNPYFKLIDSMNQNTAVIDGKEYINYSSYDYLGLSGHPKVAQRVMESIQTYGTSCSASRLIGGDKKIHRQLEQAIAQLLKVEDSIVFVGGYTTNVSCIEHLFSARDLILYDALAHNSILKGCVLSGARRVSFPHNDCEALEKLLIEHRGQYHKVLIVIEGVYSMDGDIPDLPQIISLKKKYDAYLMVDEAHSMGVIGEQGKGISEYAHVDTRDVDIWMGTLSKAFASCGGYIAGAGVLINYLKYTVPGFVYSVGMSPSNAGAALGAIEVFVQEPERVQSLQKMSDLFRNLCVERGFNIGQSKDSAVVPIVTGNSMIALHLSDELFKLGINVQPLFYPTVEEDVARLRFFITCKHTEKQIQCTIESIEECLRKIESVKS